VQFLLDHFALVALMVLSGGMLVWPEIARLFSGGKEIGTLEATRLINANALVLDVREDKEFATGHIPQARHIPLGELEKRLGEIAKFKDKPVILTGSVGRGTAAALRLLQKNQFSRLYQLKGGIAAWEQASLPLER
jgi:rhodanese-related sulfurtransferase